MWCVLNIHWSGVLPALLVVPGETAMQLRIVYTILPCRCALCVHHTAMQVRIVCTPYCHAGAHCVYTILPCRCTLCVHHTAMQVRIVCTPYCHAGAHCVCAPYCHAGAHCVYTILPCRCTLCGHHTAMQVCIVWTPSCHAGVHCVDTILPCRCALCVHHTATHHTLIWNFAGQKQNKNTDYVEQHLLRSPKSEQQKRDWFGIRCLPSLVADEEQHLLSLLEWEQTNGQMQSRCRLQHHELSWKRKAKTEL